MKRVTIFLIFIFFLVGALISCDEVVVEEEPTVDPCVETPTCIPDISSWKLHYQPYNSDCTTCHTSCTPSTAHTFCSSGDIWNVNDTRCLRCHPRLHR